MADFRLLAWLRWRQWRSSALYWLRTLGYDPQRQGLIDRMYALYLILFGLVWVFAMGIGAVYQASQIGRILPLTLTQGILAALPWVFIAAAVYLLVRSLRASPVLLSFPDMAYVAASPLSRSAVVSVNFIQSCIQNWIIILPLCALVTVVIAQPLGQPVARTAALRVVAVVAPLIPLLLALSWTAGLVRLGERERPGASEWWLAAFLLIPIAWLLPPLRWPGTAVSGAITGGSVPVQVVVLWMLALLAGVGLLRIAGRTNLIAAAEESRTYARLNALGLMAIMAPDVSIRIRRQEALARRQARFRLPHGAGLGVLAARSLLFSLRRPSALLRMLFWGLGTALTAASLVLSHAPLVLWFFWVTFVALVPPKMLVEAFEADVSDPYLRQLLPMANVSLVIVGSIVPASVLLLGGLIGWALGVAQFGVAADGAIGGGVLVLFGVACMLLSQAAAAARVGFFGWRPPYAGWLLMVVILIAGGILAFGPSTGVLVGAGAGVIALALAVSGSHAIALD